MSSDEEFQDYDEDAYDSDLFIDEDQPRAPPQQSRPTEPAPIRRYQAPPPPLGGGGAGSDDDDELDPYAAAAGPAGSRGVRRFLNPNAFQTGFGGHAFARPPASAFRRQYRAYSTAILEVQQGRSYSGGRQNLMFGGKIVMPPSALEELTQLDIELPINFEITNPKIPDLNTHVGVLEFIADEGCVNLPQWIMDQLRLNEGDPIRIVGGRYPKGKMVKLQPQSVDFLEISDPKAALEKAIVNYACLSAGDIIEVAYQSLTFRLLIMEITPPGPAISVVDTDLEVDFAPPVGYVEPEYKPRGVDLPTMAQKLGIDTKGVQEVDGKGSGTSTPTRGAAGKGKGKETDEPTPAFEAFRGSGNNLKGSRVKGKGVKAKAIEQVDEGSRIIRTDQPRIVTADTQLGTRHVPAALNLPFGTLFFGYDLSNTLPPPGSAAEVAQRAEQAEKAQADMVPFAGISGTGATLSGRAARGGGASAEARGPAGAPAASSSNRASSAATREGSAVPFSGAGNTLGGNKKKVEEIVID
ncbi:polyubiquitin-binding protein UFD1 [Sporobolomyces koalae]|uniref:polyubiquitin-binding protein UFD1 n=1 Tax=Sporobolomyces koalae TaxID=500713 RepID=UPI003170D96C